MKFFISLLIGALFCCGGHGVDMPKPEEAAAMARYIIHNTDWISLSTISTISAIKSFPFANLKSMSDGPISNGTGVPYLLMTDLDLSGQDVLVDNRVSIMASLAEINWCQNSQYDPQDPRCGRVLISGRLVKVPEGSEENVFGMSVLMDRHPIMKLWVKVHKFYVAKIQIQHICVLDFFGGAKIVKPEDYFKANYSSLFRDERQISVKLVKN